MSGGASTLTLTGQTAKMTVNNGGRLKIDALHMTIDDALISSSGQSPNVINGALQAQKLGLKTVTLSGFEPDNPLRKLGDFNLWCDSRRYNIVEMTHHIWLLAIVDYIIYNRECLDA